MKNVCFFNCTRFWGGGEKFYFDYALGLKKKNYNVFIVCDKNSLLADKSRKNKLPQANIRVGNLSFLNIFKLYRIVRFYKKEKIDTVFFSTSSDLKIGGLAAHFSKVSNIVYRRGLAVPVKNSFLNRLLLGKVVTHIVANSHETRRTILKNLSGTVSQDKISVIYNGIAVSEATGEREPLEQVSSTRNGIVLGNAGRLTAQKGQRQLLEVARLLRQNGLEFTLYIAGSGPLKSTLQDLINEYGLQKQVILLGFIGDIDRFMASIDIFLLSSEWEGFGYVLAEAMIRSKPVVAYDITSNPEIVQNKVTGFLVKHNDIEAFADKTLKLATDEALRKQFGEAGKKRILTNFQFKDSLNELEGLLNPGIKSNHKKTTA